jgi:hypothetical protein
MEDMKSEQVESVVSEKVKGNRGEVGKGTPGSRLKALWVASKDGRSLKAYVRSLLKDNPDAKLWLNNKKGKNDTKRSDANVANARAIGQATKLARRKVKKD